MYAGIVTIGDWFVDTVARRVLDLSGPTNIAGGRSCFAFEHWIDQDEDILGVGSLPPLFLDVVGAREDCVLLDYHDILDTNLCFLLTSPHSSSVLVLETLHTLVLMLRSSQDSLSLASRQPLELPPLFVAAV